MRNEAWPCRPIGDLFQIDAGKTMSAAARGGAAMRPFLRTSNVLWDEINLDQVDVMTFSDEEFAAKQVLPGDLLVCEGGEIGRAAIWNGELDQVSFQNHLHRLRPRVKGIEPRFYVFFLQSAFTQLGVFEGAGNKTTIPNLSRNRLAVLEVPVPALPEQRAIVAALSAIRTGVKAHAGLVDAAQALKRAAMRELFTRGLRGEAHKETEIGPIPESWELLPLGELAEIVYGAQAAVANATDPTIGTLILTNVNIRLDGAIDLEKSRYYAVPDHQRERLILQRGDVLFNWRSGSAQHVGKTAYFDLEGEFTFSSFILRFRPSKAVLPKFLFWWLTQMRQSGFFEGQRNVSSINSVFNASLSATIPIVVPPEDEQREIVAILDAIDSKIALHKEKRAVLEALFKSLLHKLMTGEVRVADLKLDALECAAEAA